MLTIIFNGSDTWDVSHSLMTTPEMMIMLLD